MSRGVLFVMSGASGTGKGTICKRLLENDENGLFLSVSSTTREKRAGEEDGITYNYTTVDHFKKMIEDGEMLEHAVYNGNYYGTPRKAVEDRLLDGRSVLLEIEPQGALKVKELFPDAVLMFIIPPSIEELKRRLRERGRESMEQIEERLEAARWELRQSGRYNRIFINDDLDECVNEIEKAMHDEIVKRCLVSELLGKHYI